MQPHLKNITELILQANKDSDDEVALEACEFWYVFYGHHNPTCPQK
jgi:transportin-1